MDWLSRIALALTDFVLRRRVLVICVIGLSATAAGAAILRTPVQTSIMRGLLPNEREYERYQREAATFGVSSDDLIFVAIDEGKSIFRAQTLNAMRASVDKVAALPEVEQVTTLVNAPAMSPPWRASLPEVIARAGLRAQLMNGEAPDLRLTSAPTYWPRSAELRERIDVEHLAQAVQQSPFAAEFVSRDGNAQLMIVRLASDAPRVGGQPARLTDRIEDLIRSTGLGQAGITSSGVMVTESAMFREVNRNLGLLLPIGAVVICVIVFGVFHRISLVALTLGIAIIAIVWSLGATSILFGRMSLLVAGAPLLVLVISTSDVVHIASAHMTEMEAGKRPELAMRNAIGSVGGACVLTSATTFVGFLSLAFTPSASVQHVAVALSIGVASALLLALAISPMVLGRVQTLIQNRATLLDRLCNRPIRWFVDGCKQLSLTYPRSVLALSLLLVLVCIAGIRQIELDVDFPARFPSNHRVGRGVRVMNERFFGTNTIDLVVEYADSQMTLERLAKLAKVEAALDGHAEVAHAVSLPRILDSIDRSLGFAADHARTAPQLDATLKMLHSHGAINRVISADGRKVRVSMRIEATRIFAIADLAQRVEQIAAAELLGSGRVRAAGGYIVLARTCQLILRRQIQGFLICFATVMTIVGFGLRSARLAMLSVLPNILPLLLLGGLLGLANDVVDTDILAVAIVSFGLAVDDTIHFIHRYKHERQSGRTTVREALERTFDYTGVSIIRTTVILGLGLAPFAWSNYLSLWFLGTYLVFVLAAAVIGDLLVLPATVLLFDASRPLERNDRT
jgi:predicted RND superfamily exporter protein